MLRAVCLAILLGLIPNTGHAQNEDQLRMRRMFKWALEQTDLCSSLMKCAKYGVRTVSVPIPPGFATVQRLCTTPRGQILRAKAARLAQVANYDPNKETGFNALALELVASVWQPHSKDEEDFVRRYAGTVWQTLDDYVSAEDLDATDYVRYALNQATGCG